MHTNVRSARALTAAQRRARVVELRRDRASFREIGADLGISAQAAWKLYQKALTEIPAAQLEEHRTEELTLIDTAINDLLKLARDHSRPRYAVEAWNAICRFSERKAKLLGLDAPAKRSIEVIENDVVEAEIKRLEQELLAMGATPEELARPQARSSASPVLREPSRAELEDGRSDDSGV